ncbi:Glycosyl transferase family 2 [Kushneria avicenniae]|uniref:Glycosyl transferase family 2 n=1 Tax=Kushneria avicenniae TaxID=402385 RepID=A0A1I1I8D7_9GAMM|nr:glycosyltransferase family 2 protein [Kushneria avicenniae]SFC32689.1 Glycosyl transferase family 2 [Kushneria avicenniae]
MDSQGDTWAVISTVRAANYIIESFISHYIAMGAKEIHLFLDDVSFNEVETLSRYKNVFYYECDDCYWSRIGSKPESIEKRQSENFKFARGRTTAGWTLHVDIDELLISRVKVEKVLKAVPSKVFSILVRNLEAVYSKEISDKEIFETNLFKKKITDKVFLEDIFGKELLGVCRKGFWAHDKGKSFVRTAFGISGWWIHSPDPIEKSLMKMVETSDMELLHYESSSYSSFKEKMFRRLNKKSKTSRLSEIETKKLGVFEYVFLKEGDSGLKQIYKTMNVLSGDRLKKCISKGFVVERNLKNESVSKSPFCMPIYNWRSEVLVYDFASKKIKFVTSDFLVGNDGFSQVYILLGAEFSILFFRVNERNFYLFLKEGGKIEENDFFSIKCVLNTERDGSIKFSILTKDGYMSSDKQGVVTFDKKLKNKWEVFKTSYEE